MIKYIFRVLNAKHKALKNYMLTFSLIVIYLFSYIEYALYTYNIIVPK